MLGHPQQPQLREALVLLLLGLGKLHLDLVPKKIKMGAKGLRHQTGPQEHKLRLQIPLVRKGMISLQQRLLKARFKARPRTGIQMPTGPLDIM